MTTSQPSLFGMRVCIPGLSGKSPAIVNVTRTDISVTGEWTGVHMCEEWRLHCTSQWGEVDTVHWARVLCGCHIQKDWARRAANLQRILHWAWTFLHGSYSDDSEGAAVSNWWLAAPSQPSACTCITSHAEIFGKTSNHPSDSGPLGSDVAPCNFLQN